MSKKEIIEVGSRVVTGTGAGKKGIVRFIGETEFATGEWIGIELLDAEGKNDGSVANVRYFTCPEKHGLFVKRLQVKLDKDAPPAVVEAKRSRDNEMKPPSKLPSFEDKKISSAVAAPVEEGSSTPDQVTAQPLPPPEMPIPEVLNNNANEASGNQESPTSLESEVQRERDDQSAVELQFLRQKIHDLELERNAHLTQANLQQEYDAKIKEQEEILRRKDIQIGELEKRIIGLADEIDREKQNSTQEIRSLKGMLEQAKSTGDSDQTKNLTLMNDFTSLQAQYTSLLQEHNTLLSSTQQKVTTLQREHEIEMEKERSKIFALEKQLQQENSRLRAHEDSDNKAQQSLNTLQNQIKELEVQLNTEREERRKLQASAADNQQRSRIVDLENQIAELNDNLEMVTLDAEQKQFELEERIHELEIALKEKEKQEEGANVSTPENSSTIDLLEQNNRLKEALRRLQSLHVTNERNMQSTVSKYEEELKVLKEENETLQGFKDKAEELQLQFDLQQEEMKELAQQIDDSSGYADMVEALSTKNSELSALVNKLQLTISDLEATQEVQDELDQSQRQEIDSLRKSNDTLLVGIQTIELEKNELYRKISDFKVKNDRLTKTIEKLQEEITSLHNQIEEEKNDKQLVSSRVLDERMLRRLLQEERYQVQKLKIQISNSQRNQLVAEAQATRLQLLILPLLQHISTHSTSSSIVPFLPVDSSNDFNSHLLALPSLRSSLVPTSASASSSISLTTSTLKQLLDTIPIHSKNQKTGNKTNLELLYFYIESLLSSILFNTTTVLSYCISTGTQYLQKQKEELTENQSENDTTTSASASSSIVMGYSLSYVHYLSNIALTVFQLFPLCWHLLGIFAHLSDYLQDQHYIENFYLEFERNLWIFKEYEILLQQFIQYDLYATTSTSTSTTHDSKNSSEKMKEQLTTFHHHISRIEELILKILSNFPFSFLINTSDPTSNPTSTLVWQKIFSGELLEDNNSILPLQWHQDINATTLIMKLGISLIDVQLRYNLNSNEPNTNSNTMINCIDSIGKHLERVCKDSDTTTSSSKWSYNHTKYSQLRDLINMMMMTNKNQDSQLISIIEQITMNIQTISPQQHTTTITTTSSSSSSSSGSLLIISEIISSINNQGSSVSYSWLIHGILPGYHTLNDATSGGTSSNSQFCSWVERGLTTGKELSSIIEMEEEVNLLKEETKLLSQREEILRVEKKALSRRLEDSESMLEKYMKEMKNLNKGEGDHEEKKGQDDGKDTIKKNEKDEIIILKKENKVLSEALEVMNAQLLELEEQVHKQSQNNSTPSKKNSSSKTSGSKKREEGSVSSSSSTSTGKDLEIISSTSTSLNDSNSSLTFTSSTVQQLFLSLHQEIKNWKLLTICRLIQSFKLRPLPIPKHQEYLFSRNDDLKGDKGIEEKKEYDVIKSLNTMISRHEVHKLKREIRLTRASIRIPILTSNSNKVSNQWNERKMKEIKQFHHLSSLLKSLQVRGHVQSLPSH